MKSDFPSVLSVSIVLYDLVQLGFAFDSASEK